jgi:3-methyladenine DNA glycosylase/8-oxoguanine DNA glycosylase
MRGRLLKVSPPIDLVRTTAPIWWAGGRWPNVDWRDGAFFWVGWEDGKLAWRSVRQADGYNLEIKGASDGGLDAEWASAVLGARAVIPHFEDPVLARLAVEHAGLRPWAAGSLFAGVVTSIVGQSISVAAAATTERRLFALFNDPIDVGGRLYWPPPRPEQLRSASVGLVRNSGVTTRRAEALVSVGTLFATGAVIDCATEDSARHLDSDLLLGIPGIGPWTVRSALLWGVGSADSHPTGDVALLRAAKRHYTSVMGLKDLDRLSEDWKPFRGWAARLLWLDLLGFDRQGGRPRREVSDISHEINPTQAHLDPSRPLEATGQTPP